MTHGCMDKKEAFVNALQTALNPPAPAPEPEVVEETVSPWRHRQWGHENMSPEEIKAEMAELKPLVLEEVNALRRLRA